MGLLRGDGDQSGGFGRVGVEYQGQGCRKKQGRCLYLSRERMGADGGFYLHGDSFLSNRNGKKTSSA